MNRAILVLLPAAALAACDGGLGVQCDQLTSAFTLEDAAGNPADSFGPDEAVTLRHVVTNDGRFAVRLHWDANSSCAPVTLNVRDAAGELVWAPVCLSAGHLCLCAADSLTLEPGQSNEVAGAWDQRALGETTRAPAGRYSAEVTDLTECAPVADAAASLTLSP